MTTHSADFADIPGTVLFDAQQSRKGYGLNQFCMSLMKPPTASASRPTKRPTWPNGP